MSASGLAIKIVNAAGTAKASTDNRSHLTAAVYKGRGGCALVDEKERKRGKDRRRGQEIQGFFLWQTKLRVSLEAQGLILVVQVAHDWVQFKTMILKVDSAVLVHYSLC